MKKYRIFIAMIFLCLMTLLTGCKKYLDEKPDKKLVTPSRLSDLQAIMDYTPSMLIGSSSDEASGDNYYLTTNDWNSISEDQRRIYTWEPDHLFDGTVSDWAYAYRKIYYCNTVLDALKDISLTPGSEGIRNNVQGQALMVRGSTFFNIACLWSTAYDVSSATSELGIPLRLTAEFSSVSVRSNLQQTFEQLISDLKNSIRLLPVSPATPARASRPAAYGYLSRVYLAMRNYPEAAKYADSCLQLKNQLIDYNALDSNAFYPVPDQNKEIIFEVVSGSEILSTDIARIDSNLYNSYNNDDLRRVIFFRINADGAAIFKGTYAGSADMFSGLATDEVLLNRAECFARAGNKTAALNDLNNLLIHRFRTGSFVPLTATDAQEALNLIFIERRKELVMRFIRWMDLKRLNKAGSNIGLKRIINGQQYTLAPNDLRYALPLPEDVLMLTGMQQNPR